MQQSRPDHPIGFAGPLEGMTLRGEEPHLRWRNSSRGKWFKGVRLQSSTIRSLTECSNCSMRITSIAARSSRRAGPCSKANCSTTRATGWARRFPARMACGPVLRQHRLTRKEARRRVGQTDSAQEIENLVEAELRKKFDAGETDVAVDQLFGRIERVVVSAGKILIVLVDTRSNKRPIQAERSRASSVCAIRSDSQPEADKSNYQSTGVGSASFPAVSIRPSKNWLCCVFNPKVIRQGLRLAFLGPGEGKSRQRCEC